jgi:hypothetical protein
MAQVDVEKLNELVVKADEIFLTAAGEKVLINLLAIQDQVEQAIDAAKAKLEAAALKANPNFSSIQADKIKVYYRSYGAKYYIDEAHINLAPKEFYTVESKVTYRIDTKALEKAIDTSGKVPAGIIEVERKKQLTFALKKNGKTDED